MIGLDKRPQFCEECGERLIEVDHGYRRGFDAVTGQPKPDQTWTSLDCPEGHQHWRLLGGKDSLPPLWYVV